MVFTIGIIQITTAKINEIYLLKTREEIKTELKVEISRENKKERRAVWDRVYVLTLSRKKDLSQL